MLAVNVEKIQLLLELHILAKSCKVTRLQYLARLFQIEQKTEPVQRYTFREVDVKLCVIPDLIVVDKHHGEAQRGHDRGQDQGQ